MKEQKHSLLSVIDLNADKRSSPAQSETRTDHEALVRFEITIEFIHFCQE